MVVEVLFFSFVGAVEARRSAKILGHKNDICLVWLAKSDYRWYADRLIIPQVKLRFL